MAMVAAAALQPHIRPFDIASGSSLLTGYAEAARALDLACYPPTGLWSAATFAAEFCNERTTAIGAWQPAAGDVDSEELVGMAFTTTVFEEAALTSIAVHPTSRRRGVAEALMRECMSRAAAAGATRFTLEVRAGNEAANAMYAKFGMTCVGRRKRYYANGEDALIFDADM